MFNIYKLKKAHEISVSLIIVRITDNSVQITAIYHHNNQISLIQ